MGISKTEKFTEHQNRVAVLAKALGHPARVAILQVLAWRNACYCGDIVDELPLSQATVSQHLKELKDAGLITGDVTGRSVCYCIDRQVWSEAREVLENLFDSLAEDESCC